MKRAGAGVVAFATGLALTLSACGGDDGASGSSSTIKIGYLASLTGPAATDAAQDVAGAKVAVAEINEAGGIDGRELELVVRDDKADPTTATREARDLVLTERVNVLGGGNISSVAAGIEQVAGQSKVPYVISTAGAASLIEETGNPYTFRSWTNTASLPGPASEWAAQQGFKRIAIVYANYANGIEVKDSFKSIIAAQDPEAEIVEEVPIELTDTDFSSPLNQVMSSQPDAVLLAGVFGSTLQGMVKQGLPLGLFDEATVMAFASQPDVKALDELGVPDGKMVVYNNYFPQIDDPFVSTFNDAIKAEQDEAADGSNFVGYVTVKWIAAAVEAAGSTDREEIADAFAGLTLDTFLGEITMREDGQATGQAWYGVLADDGSGKLTVTDPQTGPSEEFLSPEK